MTDKELRELLANLMRTHETYENAAQTLNKMIGPDLALRLALCRYVIDRFVPLKGRVPSTVREPF